jgi:hypothetical protein
MRQRSWRGGAAAALAGLCAASAWFGAIGMVSGFLAVPASLAGRLPWQSPAFGGVALAFVVAAPMTVAAVLAVRRHPRAGDLAALAGLMLVAWIIVQVLVIRQFSALQLVCGAVGLALVVVGNRAVLWQVADVLRAAPLFLMAPLLRRRHLRWGATLDEAAAPMPGDALVPVSHFTATRAVTIDAPPQAVWPWLVQVGFGRAGFYSYDLLDNLARRSAEHILPKWQHPSVGDIAAPMANPPTESTSFSFVEIQQPTILVWAKPDSTWTWTLRALPGGRTRLVTRLRQRYRLTPATGVTVFLAEFGDFPMMRRMLLGLKRRAEDAERARHPARAEPHRLGVSP